jgi:hypothetical protein
MISLPSDVLEYTFLNLYEADVEVCRAVCKTFRTIIDEKTPYTAIHHYHSAKDAHNNIKNLFEKDELLSTLRDRIIAKKQEVQELEASSSFFFRSWLPLRRAQLSEVISAVNKKKEEIRQSPEYDARAISCYKHLQERAIRQPIIDIFGSIKAFEALPVLVLKKDETIQLSKVTASIMRGITPSGQLFFTLRATSIKDSKDVKLQVFSYETIRITNIHSTIFALGHLSISVNATKDKKEDPYWICKSGSILPLKNAKSAQYAADGSLFGTELAAEDISTIKTFIKTKNNEAWVL